MPTIASATYVNRGILQMRPGDLTSAAMADFDEALAIDPQPARAWLNKGILRLREGKGQRGAAAASEGASMLSARRPALAYFVRGVANEQTRRLSARPTTTCVQARRTGAAWSLPREELAALPTSAALTAMPTP